jgi:hypothetical protein
MKTILITLILFAGFKAFSQDLEKIEKTDTIYVYFKKDKAKTQQFVINITPIGNIEDYFFSFLDGKVSMEFSHHYKFSPDFRKEKKSFLKRNKSIILDYDSISRIGILKATELIGYRKKIVYLIDYDDITCSKITLKQVDVTGPRRIYEE